jgi:WD40 repeat protein
MNSEKLNAAIELIRSGNLEQGRILLSALIEDEPDNEIAWRWLAESYPSDLDRQKIWSAYLTKNPESKTAREALKNLNEKIESDSAGAVSELQIGEWISGPVGELIPPDESTINQPQFEEVSEKSNELAGLSVRAAIDYESSDNEEEITSLTSGTDDRSTGWVLESELGEKNQQERLEETATSSFEVLPDASETQALFELGKKPESFVKKKRYGWIVLAAGFFLAAGVLAMKIFWGTLTGGKELAADFIPTTQQGMLSSSSTNLPVLISTATVEVVPATATPEIIPSLISQPASSPTSSPLSRSTEEAAAPTAVITPVIINFEFNRVITKQEINRLSKDGRYLAQAENDRVTIWDLTQTNPLHSLTGSEAGFSDLKFSDDNRFLLSSSVDHRLFLWDVQSGNLINTFQIEQETYKTNTGRNFPIFISVDISADGDTIAAGSFGQVTIFDVSGESARATYVMPLEELSTLTSGSPTLPVFRVQFNETGYVISAVMNGKVIGLNAVDGGILYEIDHEINGVLFANNRRLMAAGDLDGITLYDLENGKELEHFSLPGGFNQTEQTRFKFSEDWVWLGIESMKEDGTLHLAIWNITDQHLAAEFPAICGRSSCRLPAFAFSSNGERLLVEQMVNDVFVSQVYDLSDLSLLMGSDISTTAVQALAISPNGRLMAVADQNGFLTVWDDFSSEPLISFFFKGVLTLEFTENSWNLIGQNDQTIFIWSAE